jgi:hypothetical protein
MSKKEAAEAASFHLAYVTKKLDLSSISSAQFCGAVSRKEGSILNVQTILSRSD